MEQRCWPTPVETRWGLELDLAQKKAVIEQCQKMLAAQIEQSVDLYGWHIIWKRRGSTWSRIGRGKSANAAPVGDVTMYSPLGERFHSVISLKRHFGFEVRRPRCPGGGGDDGGDGGGSSTSSVSGSNSGGAAGGSNSSDAPRGKGTPCTPRLRPIRSLSAAWSA